MGRPVGPAVEGNLPRSPLYVEGVANGTEDYRLGPLRAGALGRRRWSDSRSGVSWRSATSALALSIFCAVPSGAMPRGVLPVMPYRSR